MSLGTPLEDAGVPAGPGWADRLRSAANGRFRYLVLLSHMRSYSSVLAHMLGSAPEVEGCGETHVRYRNVFDLWRLRRRIRAGTGQPLRGHWLLDKVVHNETRPVDRFVGLERMRVLIFLRRPELAIASLMHLTRCQEPGSPFVQAQACADYYVTRLHRLRADGERYGRHAMYFDAETVVERPQELLAAIGDWIGLARPPATEYRLAPGTSAYGFGDPLPNLRSGRLLDAAHSTVAKPPPVDRLALAEAQAAYERCRTALMRSCRVVPLS